ncbi:hypothetical protein J7L27_00720 [Candidatus Bathyarchaeota archaeon]|nr:hypothetical protein [Candidatus Bathyarchaeota archaeon]
MRGETHSNAMHLEKLISRDVLELILKPVTAVSVGGKSAGFIREVAKINIVGGLGSDVPFIPSESIKGTLRSMAVMLANTIIESEYLNHHMPDYSVKEIERLKEADETLMDLGFTEDQISELSEEERIDLYFALKCPVCRLFGWKGLTGKLLISDGLPNKRPRLRYFTSTAIDRKIGVASKEKLFTVESVEWDPELKFSVKIIVDNMDREEARLFSALLKIILKTGLRIGGLKSRGYGLLKIDEESNVKRIKFILKPKTEEDILSNVKALLLKEGYFEKLTIKEYIEALSQQ